MTDFNDHRRRYSDVGPLLQRARLFLASRPAESWLFFFAGIVVGAILG